jgi:hypothetical protein
MLSSSSEKQLLGYERLIMLEPFPLSLSPATFTGMASVKSPQIPSTRFSQAKLTYSD